MALRAGYYGIKNALLKKLQGLSDALVIKSIGEGLDLSAAGELSNTSTGGVDYSTTEQDTGLKWIDGRSVYKRVGQFANNTEVSTMWVEVPGVPLGDGCLILSVNALSETGTYTPVQGAVSVSSTGSNNLNIKMVTGDVTIKSVVVEYVKPATSNNNRSTKKK